MSLQIVKYIIQKFHYVINKDKISSKLIIKGNVKKSRKNETELEIDWIVEKKLVSAMSKSFVFSPKLLQAIKANCKDERHLFVLGSSRMYFLQCLIV